RLRRPRRRGRAARLAVPHRGARHLQRGRHRRRVHRDRRRPARPKQRRRRPLRSPSLRRAVDRHREPFARPERLRPAARQQPQHDDPGPRRAVRRCRPACALSLAGPQEGPDQADVGGRLTAAPITPSRERVSELVSARNVATVGIVLGVVAGWLALPPVATRSITWPLLLGILAVAAGIWAVSRAVKRPGWAGIAAGLIGISFALLALQSSVPHLKDVFTWGALLATTLVWATPLTFGALGGMMSERSGVVNIALEGMMLMGAFFGIWGSITTGSWGLGLLIAMGVGGLTAFIYGIFALHLRAHPNLGGAALH